MSGRLGASIDMSTSYDSDVCGLGREPAVLAFSSERYAALYVGPPFLGEMVA